MTKRDAEWMAFPKTLANQIGEFSLCAVEFLPPYHRQWLHQLKQAAELVANRWPITPERRQGT